MLEVVALTEAEVPSAGRLLATRHARERTRFPLLPAAYEDPTRAAELVRRTLAATDGVAAVDGGRLVGFLTSLDAAPDPSSPMARYAPARAALHLVHGHAVAEDVAAGPIYAALFARLAERALERGVADHVVHAPIGHDEAWVTLGFGRANAVAVRDLAPVGRDHDVDVRVATPDELDVVDRLVDEETVFHAGSPMFRPYRRAATVDAVRAALAEELVSADHAFLLARRDGRDIGVLSVAPGLGSPLYVPDGAVYIAATAVLPEARGAGAGAALVDAAMAWARERGHRAACLHFATTNMTSTAFWTGIGFTPVMVHVRRILDERILTDRPPT